MVLDCERKFKYLEKKKYNAERPRAKDQTQDLLAARQQCHKMLPIAVVRDV